MNPANTAVDNESPVASRKKAIALIDEGNTLEEQGRFAEAMVCYDAAVEADPQCARAHLNRGNILLAGTKIDEARTAYELAIACDAHYAGAHFNLGNLNYQSGEFEHALRNYRVATDIKPYFAEAFVGMANTLDRLNRADEAVQDYKQALAINPGYAEAHFNLGVLAMSRGRHEEAAASLRHATKIRPDFARAHHTLGVVLNILGQLNMAEESLRQALAIEPESDEILCDLAMMLLVRGKSPEGVQLIADAGGRALTQRTKGAFVRCVAYTRFTINNSKIREALTAAFTEPWGEPCALCQPALSMIVLSENVGSCVRHANELWPARLPAGVLFGQNALAALSADSLLRAVLETTPVSTTEFERFLTCARYALLESASSKQALDRSDNTALQFYAALSRQCFVNDYVFYCDGPERLAAAACRTKLLALLDADVAVPPLLILAVAAYFPLYTLPDSSRLLGENQFGPIGGVLRQQILEPLEEQTLRANVGCLTSIAGGVSEEVRDQYEQNPYPRWVKLPLPFVQALHFNEGLRQALRFARFTPLPDDSEPEALIAGCGTGSQPIIFTQRFRGVRVLAIDLSLNSLSYAQRKTRELGITNIVYAQADILELGNVNRTFDIIESVGVLHHLADPFIGWQILLTRLRPGGFMGLGFYSDLARRHLVKAREFIAARGFASSSDEIRRFRQDLANQYATPEMQWLTTIPDFYSTSECRDLLFHVQEHRLTLGQIERFISEHGLQFIGFELDLRLLQQYFARFTDDAAGTNLRNWALFEAENPDTFIGMYRFWIQKPTNQ